MATTEKPEVLEVGVDLKKVLTDMAKWQRAMMKNMDGVSRAVDRLNKTNERASKEATKGNEDWADSIEDLTKAYKKEGEEIKKVYDTVEELEKRAANAADDEKAAIEEQLKGLRKIGAEKAKALKGKEKKEGIAAAGKLFRETRGDLKSAFKDTISSVFSKDLKGIVENSARTMVKTLKIGASGGAIAGAKLRGFGAGMSQRGSARGGAGGTAMQMGGSAMKGIGSMMAKMGPMIQSLAKLGPILGTVGSALMGIVKLFLDLDAKVKAFNKDILQSASNIELMAQAGHGTNQALSDMQRTLDGLRNAAFSLQNLDWGISAEEHKAVVNVLTQEGVSIARIGQEADRAGKDVEAFAGELTHMSVAYSRAFGVPLQEINQLQAEMMTELGQDLTNTRMSFQQMTNAAEDSGIAANRFFGMIRGVSQDLSLWGTRMEDAVKILGRLGQVMNPRNAQKFMQTATQGLKNMGRSERLRLTLLTGQGKMSKLIERDTKRKAQGLAKTLGLSAEDLINKMKTEGPAGLEDAIQRLPKEMQGATREALIDMQLQQKRASKGTFGIAGAARNLGPTGALQSMTEALKRFAPGAKKLADVAGTLGGEMMADNLGISEEQLDQMIKFEASLDTQREVLKKQLVSNDANQRAAAQEALKKAGIEAKTDKELREKIDGAGYDEIMDTLSDDDKKLLTQAAKVEDMAKKQGQLTQSILDKFEVLVDFLMNQLYNLFVDIWNAILSIPGVGDDAAKERARAMQQLRTGKTELRGVVQAEDFNKALAQSNVVKNFNQAMDRLPKALDQRKALEGGLAKASPEQRPEIEKRLGALNREIEGLVELRRTVETGFSPEQIAQAAKMARVDSRGPINDADMGKVLQKVVWGSATMGRKTDVFSNVEKKLEDLGLGGTPKAAPTQAKSPGAAPGVPGSPAAAVAPGAASATEAAKVADDSLSLSKEQLDTLHSVDNQMDKFKMDTGFLSGPYSKAVEGSVLAAVRTALFEYYMYKDLDKANVVEAMASKSMTPRQFSQAIGQGAQLGKTGEVTLDSLAANASGGLVTGVNNGLAMVTAAAGEGLASVGPGERIVPSRGGGGGNTYQINVQGVGGQELARIIEAKVIDGVHEYKRKERFSS
jgi:hypothetical protein